MNNPLTVRIAYDTTNTTGFCKVC